MEEIVNSKKARHYAMLVKMNLSRDEVRETQKLATAICTDIKKAYLSGEIELQTDWYTLEPRIATVIFSWLECKGYHVNVRLSDDENQRRFYVKW